MDFIPEIELTDAQARVLARGMVAVGRADGTLDPRETELIRQFYEEDISKLPNVEPEVVASAFPSRKGASLFLRACLLVALANREYSDAEKAVVKGFADALGVGGDELRSHEQAMREYLLQPLTLLSNVESVAEVSKGLKV